MAVKVNTSSKSGRLSPNLSEINVTPLVDVMLVLLIIFMVTAPMMQPGIQVHLPSAETQGNPSSGGVIITVTKDHFIYLDGKNINLFVLETQIKNYFSTSDKKKIVFIKADKGVEYGFVVDVMDALKKSGVETVGMVVDIKEKK